MSEILKPMTVCCICITYKAEPQKIWAIYDSLSGQIDEFITVNNNDITHGKPNERFPGTILETGSNVGIARAQNLAINEALGKGHDFILLTDQDTIYPTNFITIMMEPFYRDDCVGAVAPQVYDKTKQENQGFAILGKKSFKRKQITNITPILHANASGLLIKTSSFKELGLMNENLFIDWVDFEWCWRFLKTKYKIVAQPGTSIEHKLGDQSKKTLNLNIATRNNQRYYYIIRNGIALLISNKDLDGLRKLHLFLKIIKYFCGYILISENKQETFYVLKKAVKHGIVGNLGKYEI